MRQESYTINHRVKCSIPAVTVAERDGFDSGGRLEEEERRNK